MNNLLSALSAALLALVPAAAVIPATSTPAASPAPTFGATVTPISPWVYGSPVPLIKPTISSSTVQIPGLASAGLCIVTNASGTLSVASCGGAGTTFTTTTINGLSSTAYLFVPGTGISISTSSPGSITFTNTGVTTTTGNWIGTVQGKTLGTISTFASNDYLTSSTAYLANPFTGNVSAGGFNLTGIGNLTATSATIGTLNISSLAASPLIIGGSSTTTIYGDGTSSVFPGGLTVGTLTGILKGASGVVGTATPATDYIAGGVGTSTQLAYFSGSGVLTSSANNTTDGTNLNTLGYIGLTSSTQPTPVADVVRLHVAESNSIPRLEGDSVYTANGCDVINRDNCVIVKNNQGSNITIGQAVYVNGGVGANPTVKLAQANATTTLPVLGLVASTTVANNGFTYVMTKGILSGVNTSAFSVGDILYVSTSAAGGLQNTRPTYPSLVNRVGTVLVSNVSVGQILVEVAPFVGGMESGTISTAFNIGGSNALTTSTGVQKSNNLSDLVSTSTARTNLGLTDTATIASSTFLTKATNLKSIQWSEADATSTNSYTVPIFTFQANSTIDKIYVSSRDAANTLSWQLLYSTDLTAATSTMFKVYSATQVTTSTPTSARLDTSFASSTPAAGQTLSIFTANASTTLTSFTIWYHEN